MKKVSTTSEIRQKLLSIHTKDQSLFIKLIRMILLFEPMLKYFPISFNLLPKCQKVLFLTFGIRKISLVFKQLSILYIIWMNRRFFTIKKTNGKYQLLVRNKIRKSPMRDNKWFLAI